MADKVGHGPCGFGCAGEAVYHRSTGGKLKCACSHCDRSGYAEQGGSGEAEWLAKIVRVKPAAPAPEPAPPAPTPAPRARGFDLSQLGGGR